MRQTSRNAKEIFIVAAAVMHAHSLFSQRSLLTPAFTLSHEIVSLPLLLDEEQRRLRHTSPKRYSTTAAQSSKAKNPQNHLKLILFYMPEEITTARMGPQIRILIFFPLITARRSTRGMFTIGRWWRDTDTMRKVREASSKLNSIENHLIANILTSL